jgi:hypothetical protein
MCVQSYFAYPLPEGAVLNNKKALAKKTYWFLPDFFHTVWNMSVILRFLEAVNVRRERSVARHYPLVYMKQLLMAGGGAGVEVSAIPPPPAHLVNSVASLLRAGPRLQAGSVSDSYINPAPHLYESYGFRLQNRFYIFLPYNKDNFLKIYIHIRDLNLALYVIGT